MEKNTQASVEIQLAVALAIVRNRLVEIHNEYKIAEHEGTLTDAKAAKILANSMKDVDDVLATSAELEEQVNKIMAG